MSKYPFRGKDSNLHCNRVRGRYLRLCRRLRYVEQTTDGGHRFGDPLVGRRTDDDRPSRAVARPDRFVTSSVTSASADERDQSTDVDGAQRRTGNVLAVADRREVTTQLDAVVARTTVAGPSPLSVH